MKHVTVQPSLLLANALYARAGYFGGVTLDLNFNSPTEGYIVSVIDGLVFNSMSEVNEHKLSAWFMERQRNWESIF